MKIDYKNLIGFLTTKELNRWQVRWAEMLLKYYFEIEYVKGTDNIRVNVFSWKAKLQGLEKLLKMMLRLNKESKIRYNYLKLVAIYKVLKSI